MRERRLERELEGFRFDDPDGGGEGRLPSLASAAAANRSASWVIASLLTGCVCSMVAAGEELYHEQNRPQFHFSPPQQWMNDPNGMVYFDGEYHLFYQYNPYANTWGPMHWGQAISADLVHWQNLPIALFPDVNGVIFSGSAVVDATNSSGFGARSNPPLVAVYTLHDSLKDNLRRSDIESQGVAYSLDRGRTWTKDADNPVIASPGTRDFRDPKVFWYAPHRKWIMALAVHDHVAFYSSPDLKHWSHESDFGKDVGSHGGVWECPDLIGMDAMGGASSLFVLLVSVGSGAPNGGSGTQYFVGKFDGRVFELDKSAPPGADSGHWVDYGTDDYAGSTWSGAKPGDERRLFLGWMSNWQYANVVPTQRWRGAMTLPRELKLVKTSHGLELHSLPVAELATLRSGSATIARQSLTGTVELTPAQGRKPDLGELMLDLDTGKAGLITLDFSNAQGQHTTFAIDKVNRRYEIGRAASGAVDFNPAFANPQFAPLDGAGRKVSLHAFLDHSSLEIFINDGATVFTTLFFPSTPYDTIKLSADKKIAVDSGVVYELKSIWDKN